MVDESIHGILSGFFQVPFWLRDHFATTVAYLCPICVIAVAFQFLPFRFLFPLLKERLNTSIDTSKKNNYIKNHPANPMTCRVRNIDYILSDFVVASPANKSEMLITNP